MDSSFAPIENMLNFRAKKQKDFPYQEILLTRSLHAHAK